MSMTVKAYLDRGAEDPEIRRFAVDQTVSASLEYLKGKIGQVFPSLSNKQYSLYWKDSDNDLVLFSSDDELTDALGYVTDGVFRVYIRPDRSGAHSDAVHKGVVCDSCEKEIRGVRYKCITCPDYDLCACCEMQAKHNQHDMLRICTPRPGGMPFMNFPFMHGPPPHHGPPHGGPHHGGPPHGGPEGEGGPWGPHPWKRFMRRCWRRMMREQWGAPGDFPGGPYGCDKPQGQEGQSQGGSHPGSRDSSVDSSRTCQSGDTEGGSKSEQGNGDCREEYLRNMGDSVAAMLDPLGIDVHVDIEHNGEQKHVHGGARGRRGCRGRGGRGGRGGPWRGPWGMFGGPWGFGGMWGPPPPPPPPPPHHFAPGQQQQEQQSEGDREEEMQQDGGEGTSKQQEMNMGSPSQRSDEGADWTVVGKEQEEEMKPNPDAQVVYPTLPPAAPVNPGIADALAQMKSMGYSDDGGWLSSLLEAKGGNINAVLDALQPKQ